MVVVHARTPIKPEAREQWRSIVDAVAEGSRAEDACRGYRVYEDVEAPNSFIFVEEWDSIEALHRHFRTPHFTEFFAALADVLAGPPEGSVHEVTNTLALNDALAGAEQPETTA